MSSIDHTLQTSSAAAPALFDQASCDCLEASTLVLMGDGSLRPIREIRPGDEVSVGTGRSFVVDVVRGRESEVVCFETEAGAILRTTADHPLATLTGPKLASEIEVEESMVTPAGSAAIVKARSVEHGEFDVFNLVFQESTCFFVDGFVVGDHGSQLEILRGRDEAARVRNAEDMRADFERLQRSLGAR